MTVIVWLITIAATAWTQTGAAAVSSFQLSIRTADVVCGPRCAQFVLRFYGVNKELSLLIDEIQNEDWSTGATLQSINDCLVSHGIHTAVIKVPPDASIVWKCPVVLHLRPRNGKALGHFVVQMPPREDGIVSTWIGLAGFKDVSHESLSRMRSGFAILTAPVEIVDPGLAIEAPTTSVWTALAIGVTISSLDLCAMKLLDVYSRRRVPRVI